MKKLSYPIVAAIAALFLVSANAAKAGNSDSCCSSGCCHSRVVASPKVQAMLDERCKSQCAAPAQAAVSTTARQTEVAASPKVQQMRAGSPSGSLLQPAETAGYTATGADGITASPKVRATLDEHHQIVEIAPLK